MTRTSVAALVGALAATLFAWQVGGTVAGGVLAGYFLGAGIAGLGLLYQRHALLHRPQQAFAALSVSFLAKLVVLLLGALSFRYLEAAAARADWKAFLLAFSGAVCFLLPFGAWDLQRTMRQIKRARVADSAPGSSERLTPKQASCGSS